MDTSVDKKDREIIQELQVDSRQGYSEIAKKVHLSKEVVRYRVKRLEDLSIISKYTLILNATKIGQQSFRWYLQFENTNKTQLKEIIDSFVKNPYCIWTSTCTGRWDLIVVFSVYSPRHFDELTRTFLGKYSGRVRESQFVVALDVFFYKTEMFGIPDHKIKTLYWGGDKEEVKFDKEDICILKELAEDPRSKTIDIAKKYHLSFETVKRHLMRMEKTGLFQGTSITINYAALGLETYKVFFHLKHVSKEKEEELLLFLSSHPNIAETIRTLGNWDLEVNMVVKNSNEYHQIMMDMKDSFAELIENYTISQVFDNYKYNLFPMADEMLKNVK